MFQSNTFFKKLIDLSTCCQLERSIVQYSMVRYASGLVCFTLGKKINWAMQVFSLLVIRFNVLKVANCNFFFHAIRNWLGFDWQENRFSFKVSVSSTKQLPPDTVK